ncbi:hypothetical protein KI387_039338, partial [Taxus chinensis]
NESEGRQTAMAVKNFVLARSGENSLGLGGGNGSTLLGGASLGLTSLGHSFGLQGSCVRELEQSPSNPNPNPSKSDRDACKTEAGGKGYEMNSKNKTYVACL